ncbi:MAG: hypothetical protein CL608_11100 [Anaerolineaceae bacterium]|nr:hypothetical protein [Anaerolineaceae bacterium]
MWLALILLIFTACTPTTETAVSPQPSPETAVLPTATVPPPVIVEESATVAEATAVPNPTQPAADPTPTFAVEAEPTAAEAADETGVISGRTDEGAFFLGDPNAPITHIDYSDFL